MTYSISRYDKEEDSLNNVVREEKDGLVWTYQILPNGNKKLICGAKTRSRNGKPCLMSPLNGKNRCKLHGGASPVGVTHPKFVHGRYSRDLIGKFAERYTNALNDEENMNSLRDEIHITTARISELLERIDLKESGENWKRIKENYKMLQSYLKASNMDGFRDAFNDMGRIISKGAQDYQTWDDIFKAVEVRRKLVDSERKRIVDMQQMLTADEAKALLLFIMNTIKFHVQDEKTLQAIANDVQNFVATRKPR